MNIIKEKKIKKDMINIKVKEDNNKFYEFINNINNI